MPSFAELLNLRFNHALIRHDEDGVVELLGTLGKCLNSVGGQKSSAPRFKVEV
jgi:hypothetical protein